VLLDGDAATLECIPSHLNVYCKVAKSWVLNKLAIPIHPQVLEVVAKGDRMLAWSTKLASPVG